MNTPELKTDRLILRGHTLDDFEQSFAMWRDPHVTRFIGGKPSTEEEVWSRLLRYFGLWPALGFGYWVIADKSSGRFLGEGGLANFRRQIVPAIDDPEAGWALTPAACGQGFATEAMSAVLAWADRSLTSRQSVCMISNGNLPSTRVARKIGFIPYITTAYKGAETTLYRRSAPHGTGGLI